jgi:uncharacterized protein YbcI
MKDNKPTCGQLERTLSQHIQAFYRNNLGHQPSKVTCQLFDQKLAIIMENSITVAEELLATKGNERLAEEVRSTLDETIKPQLKALIEKILQVEVVDLLSDATLETSRTGIIAVLTASPQVSNQQAILKVRQKSSS